LTASSAHGKREKLFTNHFLDCRHLATGIQFRQLVYSFRISKSDVAVIVEQVCKAIWKNSQKQHMPEPTLHTLKRLQRTFGTRGNFPIALGVLMANT
jgi:hypothetical protein